MFIRVEIDPLDRARTASLRPLAEPLDAAIGSRSCSAKTILPAARNSSVYSLVFLPRFKASMETQTLKMERRGSPLGS